MRARTRAETNAWISMVGGRKPQDRWYIVWKVCRYGSGVKLERVCVCACVWERERKKERERSVNRGRDRGITRGDRNVEKKRRKGEIRGRGNPDHFGGPPTPFASTFSVHIVRSCPVKESLNHCFLSLPCRSVEIFPIFPRFPYEFRSLSCRLSDWGAKRRRFEREAKNLEDRFGRQQERQYAVSVLDENVTFRSRLIDVSTLSLSNAIFILTFLSSEILSIENI